jgi:UDP-N-acetylmuramate dehydrogenase
MARGVVLPPRGKQREEAEARGNRVQAIEEIKDRIRGEVLINESLSGHTTYRVGGAAEILACPRDSAESAWVYRYAKREKIPLTILGAGSNVIAPDDGIAGIVLKIASRDAAVRFPGDGTIIADAGVSVVDCARAAARAGLSGLEPIAGVPGTIGGAVVMNAKVVGDDTASLIESVEVITSSGKERVFGKDELTFDYRSSIFQRTDWLISRVGFRLRRGDAETIMRDVENEWRTWRANFPLEPPNAGSVFKRPPGDYAGRLIEEAGCKYLRVGDAVINESHCNFILNRGNATAADILELISRVRKRVYEKTGVYLELEQIPLSSNRVTL